MKFSQISFIALLFFAYIGNVLLLSSFLQNDQLAHTTNKQLVEIPAECEEVRLVSID